jgi:hypothetical protein
MFTATVAMTSTISSSLHRRRRFARGQVTPLVHNLAFAQEGDEAEVCCKRRRRVRQLLHQVRDETQLALKTIKKLLIQAGGFTRGLRFRGFRRVQFSAQKSGMNAGYISGYEDVVQM